MWDLWRCFQDNFTGSPRAYFDALEFQLDCMLRRGCPIGTRWLPSAAFPEGHGYPAPLGIWRIAKVTLWF